MHAFEAALATFLIKIKAVGLSAVVLTQEKKYKAS